MDFINNSILLAGVEIGTHYYWDIAGFAIHGQVFIVSWFVIGLLLTAAFLGAKDPKRIPESWQNFMEATVEFTQEIARNQLGESSYRTWDTAFQVISRQVNLGRYVVLMYQTLDSIPSAKVLIRIPVRIDIPAPTVCRRVQIQQRLSKFRRRHDCRRSVKRVKQARNKTPLFL